MMRLLKIAKLGAKDRFRHDASGKPDIEDEAADVVAGSGTGDAASEEAEARSSDEEPTELETEIAAILAMIRSGKPGDAMPRDLPEETGATYQLLSELDRLWRSA